MKSHFFDEYTRSFDETDVLHSLGMPRDHVFGNNIKEMLLRTDEIAKPKAFFLECVPESITEDSLTLEGVTFKGSNMAKKLKDAEVIYPHAATCGKELADYGLTLTDMMEKYAFDAVMEFYRRQINSVIRKEMDNLVPKGKHISITSPGSLRGWDITQQRKLFELFENCGDLTGKAGITLTESCLMFPVKSTSGMAYATTGVDHDCAICQREKCPDRKVPFDIKKYLTFDHDE